jgi:GNAT superfamily N-acetyltransferase
MVTLKVLTTDDWREWRELRLLALTDAPDAFGSTLAEWQGEHDTEARWRNRLVDVPYNAHAVEADLPIGQVSGYVTDDPGVVELISMYVRPEARGTGAGVALIDSVREWARSVGAHSVTLGVRSTNAPAIARYERSGFVVDASGCRTDCDMSMVRPLSTD